MSEDRTRRRFVQAIGGIGLGTMAGCLGGGEGSGSETATEGAMTDAEMTESGEMTESDGMTDSGGMDAEPTAVRVRIENVAPTDFYGADTHTGGQIWITPGAYAIHPEGNPLFAEGEPASVGLEALAEAGPPTGFPDEPGLVAELQSDDAVVTAGAYTPADTVADPNDPMGEVPGAPPIAPGGAFEFTVEAGPGDHLSIASMFVPSNDVFLAPGAAGIELWPMDGDPVAGDVTDALELWDAGTEPNAQPPGAGPDQAPAQSSPEQGDDEEGVVRPLSSVDDGYRYPAVGDLVRLTVTPVGSMEADGGSMNESDGGSMNDTRS